MPSRPNPPSPLHTLADDRPSLALTLLLTAAAGGMGWGIRGQYGHESGAMIAGALVALVIGLLFCKRFSSLSTARMVALAAVGASFGGAMTYGQTVGLTHDAELVGNWAALRWGMLGLAIKGGVWIGFAGLLMGMGLGGKRYGALEILLLFFALSAVHLAGLYLLNEPFEPAQRRLPAVYFSGDWRWFPDKADLEPRRECWGGYLLALIALWGYVAAVKRDAVARNVALFAVVFGAIGFPLGQSIQAYHAWNAADFKQGWLGTVEPYMNWWNAMETVFGMTMGFGLGLGAWLNRRRLAPPAEDEVELSPPAEAVLLAVHASAVAVWNFAYFPPLDRLADQTFVMGLLPLALTVSGRYAAYFIALPIVALPICGKTLRELSYYHAEISPALGWMAIVVAPLAVTAVVAAGLAQGGRRGQSGASFARWSLLLSSWLYFWLNFGFFRFPWPWQEPTARSPSALVFSICLLLLTLASLAYGNGSQRRLPSARSGGVTRTGAR
ncbi:MAG: hypothetical protein IT424_11200 [Pirellulales bacterium]|nr:hypothetical protein [Pirellulales bacterium]